MNQPFPERECSCCGTIFIPRFEDQTGCSSYCWDSIKKGLTIWNSTKIQDEFMEMWKKMFLMIGDDPERSGLLESPKRILHAWQEMFEGQTLTNDQIAETCDKCFEDENHEWFDGMVVESNIPVFTHCEHHFILCYDVFVNIGYIPKGKVIGLSKMARVAELVSKRPQLQERLGDDIREILSKILGTDDIIVSISGKHGCMTARGIKKPQAITKTASLGGCFATEPETRKEFYDLIKL